MEDYIEELIHLNNDEYDDDEYDDDEYSDDAEEQ